MKKVLLVVLACVLSAVMTTPASAIEFEGGILGKLFNGDGCSRCAKEEAEPAPTPSCECPAPSEEAPAADPVAACPEPTPPAASVVYYCPVVVAASEPDPAPEPVAMPEAAPVSSPCCCCCPTVAYEMPSEVVESAEPAETTAVEPNTAQPIETIISEEIIYEGAIEPETQSATTAPDASGDIFGPANDDGAMQQVRVKHLVFTPTHGWSKVPAAKTKSKIAPRQVVLKKSTGKPAFRLTFTSATFTK